MQVHNAMLDPSVTLAYGLSSAGADRARDDEPAAPADDRPKAQGVIRSITSRLDDAAVAPTGPSPVSRPGEMNLDELMGAWGTGDPRYDLNADGTVNVLDLLALLASMNAAQGGQEPAATQFAAEPGSAPPPELTIEGLMNAWGKNDPDYDLNGDGVVDVQDLLALLAKMNGPAAPDPLEPATAAEVTGSDTAAAGAASPDGALTIEGLLAAWGKGDSPYDLNGNGVVNVQDLLMLLAKMNGAGPGEPTVAAAEQQPNDTTAGNGAAPTSESLTIDGLMAAWGQSGSQYDLNGDGTVNVQDLLALLAKMTGTAPGAAGPEPGALARAGEANETGRAGAAQPDQPLTVENLLKAWGQADPRFDINGDGTVNVQDLLLMLARQSGPDDASQPAVAATRLHPIARALMDKLDEAGFGDQPPTNIHELVEHLRLPPGHHKMLMEALAARYPDGLGLNVLT